MSKNSLLQLSGLAGVISGVLLILLDIAFIVVFSDQPERVAASSTTWLILLDLNIVAVYLGLLALTGIYARQHEESGRFGLAAFLIAVFGMFLYGGFLWGGGFIVPALTTAAPDFLDQVEANPPTIVALGFISTFVILTIGWLLVGISSVRAGIFPKFALWLLILGAILDLVSRIIDLGIASILFGIALSWLGWWLWQES